MEKDFVELPLHPSGVYLLVHRDKVVYVGQSVNVLARISRHRSNWDHFVKDKKRSSQTQGRGPIGERAIQFDKALVHFCRYQELDRIECELIEKYKPELNVLLTKRQSLGVKVDLVALGFNPDYTKRPVRQSSFDQFPKFRRPAA